MKKLLTLVLTLTTFAFTAQTKVDLAPYGLKATMTVPAEYGEVKVDSSSFGKFTEWKIKAGNFKLKMSEMDKQAGYTPESMMASGKKELEKKTTGPVVFVKYIVNEKNAMIAEMKKKDVTTYTIVHMFLHGNKMYTAAATMAEVSEADARAMLTASKGLSWSK